MFRFKGLFCYYNKINETGVLKNQLVKNLENNMFQNEVESS